MYNNKENQGKNVSVMVRIRPPFEREIVPGIPFRSIAEISQTNTSISLIEYLGVQMEEEERQHELAENPNLFLPHIFTFDYVFDMSTTQEEVYDKAAKPAVQAVLEGYNSTIFAYGQTGTGKTHTMQGFTYNPDDPERGIVPRSIEDFFSNIENSANNNTKFIIRASYLQIYNEVISDLLKPEMDHLNIREDKKKGIYVAGLSDWVVRNPNDIFALLEQGAKYRATSSTIMNDVSSRSHAIFILTVEQMVTLEDDSTLTKIGKLNLVDLAGSERIRVTGARGKQLEESKRINKALSALGNVINALTEPKKTNHVPYRDSKLTRLLEDSLGGNCITTMITMISPCHDFFNESLSSLLFAKRAKNIKNRPIINKDINHHALISQYEIELKRLKLELEEKNRMLQSNELLLELEAQKKKAENDKKEVLKKLELTSKQYLKEREEKNKLEMKISLMNSQMIIGGKKIEDTPQFRSALEERKNILFKELDNKFQEFEKERVQLEEDKADIDRYKQLLLKQRDLMISLTTKLNEKDETIIQLHDELEINEQIKQKQEELIEIKNKQINSLINYLKDNKIEIPEEVISIGKEEELLENKRYPKLKSESKMYLSYDSEKGHLLSNNLGEDNVNHPLTFLSAEEKIKELKGIIKDQEKEIGIMKLVTQKFISTSCEDEKINLDDIIKSMQNGFELHSKIHEIQNEKNEILKDFEKQNEALSIIKGENDNLFEQNSNLEKQVEKNEKEINDLTENMLNAQDIVNNLINEYGDSNDELKRDLFKVVLFLSGNNYEHFNYKETKKPENKKIVRVNKTSKSNIMKVENIDDNVEEQKEEKKDVEEKFEMPNSYRMHRVARSTSNSGANTNINEFNKSNESLNVNSNNYTMQGAEKPYKNFFMSKFINASK